MKYQKPTLFAASAFLTTCLTACGGSGGGSDSDPTGNNPTPNQPSPDPELNQVKSPDGNDKNLFPYTAASYENSGVSTTDLTGTWVAITHDKLTSADATIETIKRTVFIISGEEGLYQIAICSNDDFRSLNVAGNEVQIDGMVGQLNGSYTLDSNSRFSRQESDNVLNSTETVTAVKVSGSTESFASMNYTLDGENISINLYCASQRSGYSQMGDVLTYTLELEAGASSSDETDSAGVVYEASIPTTPGLDTILDSKDLLFSSYSSGDLEYSYDNNENYEKDIINFSFIKSTLSEMEFSVAANQSDNSEQLNLSVSVNIP